MFEDAASLDGAREHVVGHVVDLARALRDRGAEVPADGSLAAARALAAVGLSDRDRVHTALRATLVSREADLDTFDALFPAFWRQLRGEDDHHVLDPAPEMDAPPSSGGRDGDTGLVAPDGEGGSGGTESADGAAGSAPRGVGPEGAAVADDGVAASVYSPAGAREAVSDTATGVNTLRGAVGRLVDALSDLPGRRWTGGGAERIDIRRALRRGVAGTTPLPLPRRDRAPDAADVVLLVDVSRSVLDTVDRGVLLGVAAELRRACRTSRVFFFDTDIREVTDAFGSGDPGVALERAEAEWGGGTRIGHALGELRERYPDAVERTTTVLVVSDGLEVGELEALEAGMAWLSGRAGGVLWLNPLAAAPEYEPATRGMARSLPYVDGLFAFADAADLAEVARQVERFGLAGPIGYEHDPRRAD